MSLCAGVHFTVYLVYDVNYVFILTERVIARN